MKKQKKEVPTDKKSVLAKFKKRGKASRASAPGEVDLGGVILTTEKLSKRSNSAENAEISVNEAVYLEPICELNPNERAYFDAVAEYMNQKGLLETVDTLILTMLAKNVALWIEVSNSINTLDDLTQTFDSGAANISPLFVAKDRLEVAVLKTSTRLGLSPLDRSKLFGTAGAAKLVQQRSQDGDNLDSFLSKGKK